MRLPGSNVPFSNAAQYNIGLRMLPELLGDLAASTSEPGLFL